MKKTQQSVDPKQRERQEEKAIQDLYASKLAGPKQDSATARPTTTTLKKDQMKSVAQE